MIKRGVAKCERGSCLIGLSIRDELDHALSSVHCSGSAVGHEAELADLVVDALLLHLLLRLANRCHLPMGSQLPLTSPSSLRFRLHFTGRAKQWPQEQSLPEDESLPHPHAAKLCAELRISIGIVYYPKEIVW